MNNLYNSAFSSDTVGRHISDTIPTDLIMGVGANNRLRVHALNYLG